MELLRKKDKFREFEKVAMTFSVSDDPLKWSKEIITEFLSQYPVFMDQPVDLTWRKKDDRKGYAVGSLHIAGGSVPIIIKDFKVSPLDIIVFPGAVLPLDKFTIAEITSSNNPFIGAYESAVKPSLSIFGDRGLTPSPREGAQEEFPRILEKNSSVESFLEKISSFDVKDVQNQLNEFLEFSPELEDKFSVVFKKIANKAVDYDKYWIKLINNVPIDRQFKYEDSNGNKFVKQAYSKLDYVFETKVSDEDFDSIMNKTASYTNVNRDNINDSSFVVLDKLEIGQDGQFFDQSGNCTDKVTILEITKLAELKDYIILPLMYSEKSLIIGINGENDFYILNEKINKPRNLLSLDSQNLITKSLERGDKYTIVVRGKAFPVFMADDVVYDFSGPGKVKVKATLYDGTFVELILLPHITGEITKDKSKPYVYFIPGNAKLVKLGYKVSKPDNTALERIISLVKDTNDGNIFKISALNNSLEKVSFIVDENATEIKDNIIPANSFFGIEKKSKKLNISVDHSVYKDSAGLYHFIGPEFEKYASNGHSINGLTEDEAIWPLVHLGVSEDTVDKVRNLHYGQEVKISEKIRSPFSINEFKEKVNSKLRHNIEDGKIPVLRESVKLAANLDASSLTVDAVLSLGLINKFNIMDYLELIPDYERVLSELTRLLLFSRLTNLSFDPRVLTRTVHSFNEVITNLKKLKSLLSYEGVDRQSTL